MKKIRICIFMLMLMLSVFALTACGGRDNSTDQTATQTTTQNNSSQSGSQDDFRNGSQGMNESGSGQSDLYTEEESTGVIDGMMNDVESGVNDLLDTTDQESNRSDESK